MHAWLYGQHSYRAFRQAGDIGLAGPLNNRIRPLKGIIGPDDNLINLWGPLRAPRYNTVTLTRPWSWGMQLHMLWHPCKINIFIYACVHIFQWTAVRCYVAFWHVSAQRLATQQRGGAEKKDCALTYLMHIATNDVTSVKLKGQSMKRKTSTRI